VTSTRKDAEKAAAGLPHSKCRAPTPESGDEPPHSKGAQPAAAGAVQNLECWAEVAGGEVVERLEAANQFGAG
jgi:hypothetical protein